MPKFIKIWPLLVFMVLLVGCQPVDSLNPLYMQKDVVFDPALLGRWTEEGGTLQFFESADHSYTVVFTDDSKPAEQMVLTGHLVSLQGHRFLDLAQKKWVGSPELYPVQIDQTRNGPAVTPSLLHAGDGAYLEFAGAASGPNSGQVIVGMRIAHWFFRVFSDEKNLRLTYIDDTRLEKLLDAEKVQITHVLAATGDKDSRQLLLTAATADLQQLVVGHVNDNQVFSDTINLKRSGK